MTLKDLLLKYTSTNAYPMHMPGHKRNQNFSSTKEANNLDITEIDGFDNLFYAESILKDAMDNAAKLWGAKKSYFLVGGSSCGLFSAISAVCNHFDKLIVARNCHKSVYHAIELRGIKPIYLTCDVNDLHINSSVNIKKLEQKLIENPDCKGVVIVSPTYEGVLSDIKSISEIVHKYGKILIVDEAHGAHLGFSDKFPNSAVKCGADIVIQSLHKTLPCYTQSAILHICSDNVDIKRIEKYLSFYQTSSPSYVLLSSMDLCVNDLQNNKDELFKNYENNLREFKNVVKNLENLEIPYFTNDEYDWFDFDIGKIYISTVKSNINGVYLDNVLRDKYQIEPEFKSEYGVLCMTSIADTKDGFMRLGNALLSIDKMLKHNNQKNALNMPKNEYEVLYTPFEMSNFDDDKFEKCSLESCEGRISNSLVYAYPPGIPYIVPGERISANFCDLIRNATDNGINIIGLLDNNEIIVLKKKYQK